ncbi:protein tyrosine phosphatase [Chitinophagaceae bacterium IBVUCB1]|jgi:predicted protein tyrosine phosphatase|nr:protein tyrosine phosphatase [Chitinophagaceae bacterium IBVUCB1]
MNILFVCSRNQWRSPTAEAIYKNVHGITAKSAGTSPSARIRVNESLIQWADMVFVMEDKHKQILLSQYPLAMQHKQIVVMDIPDEYKYMNKELIEMIQDIVSPYIV